MKFFMQLLCVYLTAATSSDVSPEDWEIKWAEWYANGSKDLTAATSSDSSEDEDDWEIKWDYWYANGSEDLENSSVSQVVKKRAPQPPSDVAPYTSSHGDLMSTAKKQTFKRKQDLKKAQVAKRLKKKPQAPLPPSTVDYSEDHVSSGDVMSPPEKPAQARYVHCSQREIINSEGIDLKKIIIGSIIAENSCVIEALIKDIEEKRDNAYVLKRSISPEDITELKNYIKNSKKLDQAFLNLATTFFDKLEEFDTLKEKDILKDNNILKDTDNDKDTDTDKDTLNNTLNNTLEVNDTLKENDTFVRSNKTTSLIRKSFRGSCKGLRSSCRKIKKLTSSFF